MFVDHLQLADFRCYESVDVPLGAGVTIFVGANGQGKTNLVEAVDYLATLGSHRVATENPLVRAGAEQAVVRARVQAGLDDPRVLQLEVVISPGRTNRAKLNRSPLSRPRDLLGALRTVLFSPEDLAVVKGDPSERRRYLDELVAARWPRLAGVRADYDRVLRQRSTLLKSMQKSGAGRRGAGGGRTDEYAASTLDVWDDQLARLGAEVMQARFATLTDLVPHLAKAYADIAPRNNAASADYKTTLEVAPDSDRAALAEVLRAAMVDRRTEEIQRGVTLVGPHRDDLSLVLGDLPTKGYASHGESWSFALALKLASFQLLRSDGLEPVLLLDDVFAELDTTRRERLAGSVADAEQVLVTAAVGADVPAALQGTRYLVADGEVRADA